MDTKVNIQSVSSTFDATAELATDSNSDRRSHQEINEAELFQFQIRSRGPEMNGTTQISSTARKYSNEGMSVVSDR